MKNRILIAGASACAASVVHAADLPFPVADAPIPVVEETRAGWTGFYIGAFGGWGWGEAEADFATPPVLLPIGAAPPVDLDPDGAFVGGTIGFDLGFGGGFVIGVLGDYSAASIHDSGSAGAGAFATDVDFEIDQMATARGRLGWETSNWLGYVTGGWAWAHVDRDIFNPALPDPTESTDNWHNGWTVGAGFEYALSNRWSAKAEYLYTDLGEENYSLTTIPGSGTDVDLTLHTVKLGLNLRFGGF